MSYQKGDPDCMKSEDAMKNIKIVYKTNKIEFIEANWDYVYYYQPEETPEGFDKI